MEKRDKKYRAFLIFLRKNFIKKIQNPNKKIFFLHIVCVQFERRCCCDKRSNRASKNNR